MCCTGLSKINGAKLRFGVRFFLDWLWVMHQQAKGAGRTGGVPKWGQFLVQPCSVVVFLAGGQSPAGEKMD